jgi:MoxR-like ATPase
LHLANEPNGFRGQTAGIVLNRKNHETVAQNWRIVYNSRTPFMAMPNETPRPKLNVGPIAAPASLSRSQITAIAGQLIANVEKVIVGKHDQIVLAVATLLAEGHLLIEDVPGVAKTMLARALAISAGGSFKRIQCTPDLQPLDVLGDNYTNAETGRTEFRFGPLFSQFVLVDEVNRASPRTQAAMLEAMGENMVTAGNISYKLQRPFMVIATQNPIEQEGTFFLPEAQKDRFLIQLSLGYPALADENQMLERFKKQHPIETLSPVATPDQLLQSQDAIREIEVVPEAREYILALVRATREHPALLLGASPRGSLGLFRVAQAMVAIEGGNFVRPEQIKRMAQAVLGHRLIIRREDKYRNLKVGEVIEEILAKLPLPY